MRNLWTRGIFWITVMFAITSMLTMMVNGHFNWYHYLFIMVLLPGLFIIISSIILIRPGSLTGRDLIELLKYTSKLIYGSILALVNRKDREQH
jgi:hypothetical protein